MAEESVEGLPFVPIAPTDQHIAGSRVFTSRLVAIDGKRLDPAEVDRDNKALGELLRRIRGLPRARKFIELEAWLNGHRNSRWFAALQHELLGYKYDRGYFAEARQGWDELWKDLKSLDSPEGRGLADSVLQRLLNMNIGIARSSRLKTLIGEAEERGYHGALEGTLFRARRNTWLLDHVGAQNVMCGPLALHCIKDYLDEPFVPVRLNNVTADLIATGIPLTGVQDYATDHYGLPLKMARRTKAGTPIPTPAVMHLKDEHYAALLERNPENGDYFLEDRTLEFAGWVDSEAVEAISSGYFLVAEAQGRLPSGWENVEVQEGRNVFGRDGAHGTISGGENTGNGKYSGRQCSRNMGGGHLRSDDGVPANR